MLCCHVVAFLVTISILTGRQLCLRSKRCEMCPSQLNVQTTRPRSLSQSVCTDRTCHGSSPQSTVACSMSMCSVSIRNRQYISTTQCEKRYFDLYNDTNVTLADHDTPPKNYNITGRFECHVVEMVSWYSAP